MSWSDLHTPSHLGDSEGTRVAPPPWDLSGSSESTEVARHWHLALEELHARREARLGSPAVGVVVHRRGVARPVRCGVVFVDDRLRDPRAIVFGRHPSCDLAGLRDASLRHGLLLVWPGAKDGLPPLEVLDLRSRSGLVLSRHETFRHVRSPGPLRFGVGSDELTVLHAPAGGRFPAELPSELDGWAELERQIAVGLTRPLAHPAATNVSFVHRREDGTLVRLLDGGLALEEGAHVVRTSREQLRAGLLLGRYARCDEASTLGSDRLVSRVHALVVERRGALYVVDVGSSNGTRVVDARTGEAVVALGDRRRVKRLGEWERIEIGESTLALEVGAVH